jgi:hypothetical protein
LCYASNKVAGRGITIGKAEGEAETKAQMLVCTSAAKGSNDVVAMINDTNLLLDLIVNLAHAQSTEEAQQILHLQDR